MHQAIISLELYQLCCKFVGQRVVQQAVQHPHMSTNCEYVASLWFSMRLCCRTGCGFAVGLRCAVYLLYSMLYTTNQHSRTKQVEFGYTGLLTARNNGSHNFAALYSVNIVWSKSVASDQCLGLRFTVETNATDCDNPL